MSFSFLKNKTRRFKCKSCVSHCPPFLQLFSCRYRWAWLVLFWDRVACVSQDILYCLRISAVLLNSSTETGICCCLLSKQVHQSSYSHIHFSVVEALCAERGEVSFSQYLFAFGLEEEAQRFSIWDQRRAHATGRNIVFSIVLRIVVPEFPYSAFPTP